MKGVSTALLANRRMDMPKVHSLTFHSRTHELAPESSLFPRTKVIRWPLNSTERFESMKGLGCKMYLGFRILNLRPGCARVAEGVTIIFHLSTAAGGQKDPLPRCRLAWRLFAIDHPPGWVILRRRGVTVEMGVWGRVLV
jgi:hypothetical protein